MSAWIASAIPGYWTLTATSRPSRSVARWTCPIEAEAIGSALELLEVLAELVLEVLLHDLADRLERHRLGVVLKAGQDLLELGPDLLRDEPEVNR